MIDHEQLGYIKDQFASRRRAAAERFYREENSKEAEDELLRLDRLVAVMERIVAYEESRPHFA